MKLSFRKMQAAGNDFVVIDAVRQAIDLTPEQIRHLADRRLGVGCDQVLLVEPPRTPDADFRYVIYNADGSEAGQCGNGARCLGRFISEKRLSKQKELVLEVGNSTMGLQLDREGTVKANLGAPSFTLESIPFSASEPATEYPLSVNERVLKAGVLSMGNPHAVLLVNDCANTPVATLGALIQELEVFPDSVNVGFMQVRSRNQVDLRVCERVVGETPACGSGACAAVVHGIRLGLLDREVTVSLPGGKLCVSWEDDDAPVWLSGPATTVYDGTIVLR